MEGIRHVNLEALYLNMWENRVPSVNYAVLVGFYVVPQINKLYK